MPVFQSPFGDVTVEAFDESAEANYRAAGWALVEPVAKPAASKEPRANVRKSVK